MIGRHDAERDPQLGTPTALQRWIVGNGLPGVSPPSDTTVADLVAARGWSADNRLTGLLHAATTAIDSEVPDQIGELHTSTLRLGLAIEAEACGATRELRAAGIDPIVFKGVASAHLDYGDPGVRAFYDVDLLVPRESFSEAADHLQAAGWRRVQSTLGARWEARHARAAQFVAPSGVELDLHAVLAAGYFGVRLDHELLRRSTEPFELGGIEMTGFDTDARLLTSCYALVLSRGGNVRLVRDVAQQLLVSGASWERAAELAGEGDVVIAAALRAVNEWIQLPSGATDWMHSRVASPMQRCGLVLAHRAESRGWRADVAGEVLGLGWRSRLGYCGGIVAHRVRRTVGRRSASP